MSNDKLSTIVNKLESVNISDDFGEVSLIASPDDEAYLTTTEELRDYWAKYGDDPGPEFDRKPEWNEILYCGGKWMGADDVLECVRNAINANPPPEPCAMKILVECEKELIELVDIDEQED